MDQNLKNMKILSEAAPTGIQGPAAEGKKTYRVRNHVAAAVKAGMIE